MKVLISMLMLMSASLFAQDCDMLDIHYDKMDDKKTSTIKKRIAVSESGDKGFIIDFLKPSVIIWSIDVVGGPSKCIEKGAKLQVLFEDDTRLTMTNNNKFNCDGSFVVYFGGNFGNEYNLIQFRTKKIITMRVYTSSGYHEEDLNDETATKLMNTFDCISKN
jgi:hypothetical protein